MTNESTAPLRFRSRLTGALAQGAKVGVVAGLAYRSSSLVGLHEAYWAAISAIVVMQGDLGSTVSASRDRILGTAIGGVLGWGAGAIWGGHALLYALAVAVSVAVCAALGLGTAGRLTGVTTSVIVLIPRTGPLSLVALHRFLEVTWGVLVALAFTEAWARLPKRKQGA